MTCVLAFGVQGVADALTSLRKATPDSGDGAIIPKMTSGGNACVFTVAGASGDD